MIQELVNSLRFELYGGCDDRDEPEQTIECCSDCGSPLAVFEVIRSTYDTLEQDCEQHYAQESERVAQRLRIPLFKISYAGTPLVVMVRRSNDSGPAMFAAFHFACFLDRVRDCNYCRVLRLGRYASRPTTVRSVVV